MLGGFVHLRAASHGRVCGLRDCVPGGVVGLCGNVFGPLHAFGKRVLGRAVGLLHGALGPINSLGDRMHAVLVFLRNRVRRNPSGVIGIDDVVDGVGSASLEARIMDTLHHGLGCSVGASLNKTFG
ncbi:hypothetical protein CVO74_08740 [Xanthomonas prunicola]|uniref:Uncharacterized protein n=1 Tax=Xanthomonas prunicola TaxID=2053930 RepID=A0A2N3RM15_9XANT|nr:hypothetical protein XpruCFBP8353_06690 [Xanthomonas prunicola]PKV17786.1 hypothetical protein XpruCFBP8354_06690 [Xanthomonas prunicola]PKV21683.1 hypothetical protein CVO74_08740 [Xanthomonas prunicola]